MKRIQKALLPYQNMFFSGAILVFCVVGLMFAAVPSVQKIQEIIEASNKLTFEIEQLQKKLIVLEALDETVLREQLANVLSAVPLERSYPTLFETIERVAEQSGVIVENINLSGGTTLATPSASKATAQEKKIGTHTIPFSVTIRGPIESVEQFIAVAPNVRRLLRIKVFSITFPKEVNTITVTLDMDGFYEPLPQTIGKTSTNLPVLTSDDEAIISKLTTFPLTVSENTESPPAVIGKMKENPFAP